MEAARTELGYYKSTSFSAEFVGLSQKFQRMNSYESYLEALEDNKYRAEL